MHSSFSFLSAYFDALGDAAGEAEALGLAEGAAEVFGLALTDGEGIAGLCETTGTFGLADGFVVFVLQPPSIARSNRAKEMNTVVFFIL